MPYQIMIKSQLILNNMLFKFYKSNLDKIDYILLDEFNLLIVKSGSYTINISCEFYTDVIIGLFLNNVNINEIVSENEIINFHDIINVSNNDHINIKNLSNCEINIKNSMIKNFFKLNKILK